MSLFSSKRHHSSQRYLPDGRFSNFIRIGFGQPFDEAVERSLKVLRELVCRSLEV